MKNHLIIPIELRAICIGEENSKTSACFMPAETIFENLPYGNRKPKPYISHNYVHQPFNDASPLDEGVHLHWILPDALTHGNAKDGKILFPDVPNRWLVSRIWLEGASSSRPVRKLKSWVIESNYLSDTIETYNFASLAIPVQLQNLDSNTAIPYAFLGRVYDATQWKENADPKAKYLDKLSAVGYGLAHFAAYYPNCRNVFGFHDDLSDVISTNDVKISYVITGWHGPLSSDPLANIPNPDNVLEHFNWNIQNVTSVTEFDSTLYSGALNSITWNKNTDYIGTDQPKPLDLAIGYNSVEAISALFAKDEKDPSNLELLLNAIQINMADEFDLPGGKENILRSLFQNQFASSKAGDIWVTKRNGEVAASLDEKVSSELNELNILQRNYNQACHQLKQAQQQVFADWCQYLIAQYPINIGNKSASSIDPQGIEQLIKQQIANLPDTQALLSKVNDQKQVVLGLLSKDFVLQEIAAPRYWQIKDPTILLSGDDVVSVAKYKKDSKSLKCRIQSQLLKSVTVPAAAVKNSAEIIINASDVDLPSQSQSISLADVMQELMQESCILDPYQIFYESIEKEGVDNPAVLDKDAYISYLGGQLSNITQTNLKWNGELPSFTELRTWQMSWLPLMLQWETKFYPIFPIYPDQTDTNYDAKFILNLVNLDQETFGYDYTKFVVIDKPEQYLGSTFLTPNAGIKFQNQLSKYLATHSNLELKNILDKLTNLPLLTQSMGGFNQSLIMRDQTIQLDIRDPFAQSPMQFTFVDMVRKAVANNFSKAAAPDTCFNPIQAGKIEIPKLRIVDTFGRLKDYQNDNLHVSRSMMMTTSADETSKDIIILPKVTQASRLMFRWLSADNDAVEMNSHPASSPIFGWIIPNFINHSLEIYNQKGEFLGSLVYSLNNQTGKVLWQDSPFNSIKKDIQNVMKDQNPHLKDFTLALSNNGPDFFAQFLATVENSILTVIPDRLSQHNSLANLIGTPLALTRASLKLDLKGIIPEINQSWAVLKERATSAIKGDNGFSEVLFPVQVGDLKNLNDGLIGYFINNDKGETYKNFYSYAATGTSGVLKPNFDTITLSFNQNSNVTLTMIVDPRADIHAAAGILPPKSINIALDQYQSVLQNILITILMSPIITPKNEIYIPTHVLKDSEWMWVEIDEHKVKTSSVENPGKSGPLGASSLVIKEGWLCVSTIKK